VLGPILKGYLVGVLVNSQTGDQSVLFVTVLNDVAPWTPEQVAAFFSFELVSSGQDTTTPTLGLPAKLLPDAIEGYDAGAFYVDGVGVSMLAPKSDSVLVLLDKFAQAQSMGG